MSTKRTYRPSKTRRRRVYGFRAKMKSAGGRKLLKRRMLKGRRNLTP
ncbi:50S ribosomal protein L34 [Candidatus Woesebacteria bacterium RIFOXYD1_FULL_40_21]|uniref:Large ribosomal subunit protein bL34 n=1 Tax=Candidatus Woesebacteria bacterium RIFOXYD1_FULL_40_21 TaxID=1802549 RepID=A0A1F8DEI8_9BACT|nr:MAG: 50S ribosomal protein L34 [Candidatus Woesebacteria bacterium RIFOXYD1_FULL_40_21]